jgi:hypothetical protein
VIHVVLVNSVIADNLLVPHVPQERSLLLELLSVRCVLPDVTRLVVNLYVTIVLWVLTVIKALLNVLYVLWVNTNLVTVNLLVYLVVQVKWLTNWAWLYVSTVVKVNIRKRLVAVSVVVLVPMLMVLPTLCVLIANQVNSLVVVLQVVELVVLEKPLTRRHLYVTFVLLVNMLLPVLVHVRAVKEVTTLILHNKRNALRVQLVSTVLLVLPDVHLVKLVNTSVPLVPVHVVYVMQVTMLVLLVMLSAYLVLQVLSVIKQVLLYVPNVLLEVSLPMHPPTPLVPSVLLDNTILSAAPHSVLLVLLVSLPPAWVSLFVLDVLLVNIAHKV